MGLWIQIPSDSQTRPREDGEGPGPSCYYWNPETQDVRWSLPEGEHATWATVSCEQGTYYYNLGTRQTTWNLPVSNPDGAAPPDSGYADVQPTEGRWQFVPVLRAKLTEAEKARSSTDRGGPGPQDWVPPGRRGGTEEEEHKGADWVEVRISPDGQHYYWNFRRHISTRSLPAGVRAKWRAFESQKDGKFYYMCVDTGRTSWRIPGQVQDDEAYQRRSSEEPIWRWLTLGAAMRVHGLKSSDHERYNDQMGQVEGFQEGRVVVKLADCLGGPRIAVLPKNLEPLRPGALVQVKGLIARTEFNDKVAQVREHDPADCRYHLEMFGMEGGREIKVKGYNVIGLHSVWQKSLRLDANCSFLQWRKEQSCLFIDSGRHHRKFNFSLPLNFMTYQQEAASEHRIQQWPVLVYMHGTGGAGFFCHSRKSLKSVGLQYVASKFIVISPVCEWNWREVPKPWVTELVRSLRAADWCDHNRIYLAGCSMGGMSTWELGAASPEIFAAVAPVAAHHDVQRENFIAQRLCRTPTLVVHSSLDDTCPERLERELWNKLKELGHEQLEIHMAQNIDHCSMYERVFCDSTTLYDWLLMFRRSD